MNKLIILILVFIFVSVKPIIENGIIIEFHKQSDTRMTIYKNQVDCRISTYRQFKSNYY